MITVDLNYDGHEQLFVDISDIVIWPSLWKVCCAWHWQKVSTKLHTDVFADMFVHLPLLQVWDTWCCQKQNQSESLLCHDGFHNRSLSADDYYGQKGEWQWI